MNISILLGHSLSGSNVTVHGHIKRGDLIANAINKRFDISEPFQWQAKHLRWFLERDMNTLSISRQYDFWRTVRALASALGHWPDWEPHLRGSWCKNGSGGRPAKLANRGKDKKLK